MVLSNGSDKHTHSNTLHNRTITKYSAKHNSKQTKVRKDYSTRLCKTELTSLFARWQILWCFKGMGNSQKGITI